MEENGRKSGEYVNSGNMKVIILLRDFYFLLFSPCFVFFSYFFLLFLFLVSILHDTIYSIGIDCDM